MREIKFKVWDKPYKKMTKEFTLKEALEYKYFVSAFDDFEFLQFTGLIDKNGKEIYEGDIVKWDDRSDGEYWRIAIVEFDPDIQFRCIAEFDGLKGTCVGHVFRYGSFAYKNTRRYLEIIGTIFDDKVLIEG